MKSFLIEDKEPLILCSQYHVYWWPADVSSYDIRKHGIILEYSTRNRKYKDYVYRGDVSARVLEKK